LVFQFRSNMLGFPFYANKFWASILGQQYGYGNMPVSPLNPILNGMSRMVRDQ
jgi:hypothetical protein